MIARLAVLAFAVVVCGCGGGDSRFEPEDDTVEIDGLFPDVLAGSVEPEIEGTFTISATISSPYDSPERYADAFRVKAPDGTVLGVRELLHDHAAEQPFTRSLTGVEIDDSIDEVTIEGRDQVNGWGGESVTVEVSRP